jgi:trigger factor
MKVEVENLSDIRRRVAIEVPWATVAGELELAYNGLSQRARIKGFRPGKAPRRVLEQLYRGTVESEVSRRLIDDLFRKAVQEKELVPIDSPILDESPKIEKDTPFRFVATVDVKPELVIEHYKGITIEREVKPVTDVEVLAELHALRDKATVIEPIVDREKLETGDLAVVDFFGYINGETFKGGKGINYTVHVGEGDMIPGFEEELVGMKVGEQKQFTLSYPKDEGAQEARGQDVDWVVDLKELKRRILPALDDEFAKDLGEFDTLEDLKENIRKNLLTRQSGQTTRALRDKAVQALVDKNVIAVPSAMTERHLDFLLEDATQGAVRSKNPELLEALAKVRKEARPRAETQVAGILILEAIAKQENIEVLEAEIEGRLQELSREHRIGLRELKAQMRENGGLEGIRYNLRQDKTLDLVIQHAEVKEVEPKAEPENQP